MGNYSRNTFDPTKRYAGVRLQQGVPILDADWNELDDVRKHELQEFIKSFIGDGIPAGNDGFCLLPALDATGQPSQNDFVIKGGDGTAEAGNLLERAGRCLVDGREVLIVANMKYTAQPLYNNQALATKWGVPAVLPLTVPAGAARTDCAYLDVWEREVNYGEDRSLVHQAIGIETCVRLKREWAVRVAEGATEPPPATAGHAHCKLAELRRPAGAAAIAAEQIIDARRKGLAVVSEERGLTLLSKALAVKDGNVGIGTTTPAAKLEVAQGNGNSVFQVKDTGLSFIQQPGYTHPDSHLKLVDADNDNSRYIIEALGGGGTVNALHVTSAGNVGIGTTTPSEKLHVEGPVRMQSYCNSPNSFFVGGAGDKFYAVAFQDSHWDYGPAEFEISRSNTHIDSSWRGAMNLKIHWHATAWGNGANFINFRYMTSGIDFLSYIYEYPYNPYILVWLKGNSTYYYRSFGNRVILHKIIGIDNQTAIYDPIQYQSSNTAVGATHRTTVDGSIRSGQVFHTNVSVFGTLFYKTGQLSGFDYAEYFESADGTEIAPGTSVALENGKIRPAKAGDSPIGIISANPGVLGGVNPEWPKKYLHNELGEPVMEEYQEEIMAPKKETVTRERQKVEKKTVTEQQTRTEIVLEAGRHVRKEIADTVSREIEEPVFQEVDLFDTAGNVIGKHRAAVMETYTEEIDVRDKNGQIVMEATGRSETKTRQKLNPQYDPNVKYTPRDKRPEWNAVGLLGQLPLRKGQPVAASWVKIKDISENVELWLVR